MLFFENMTDALQPFGSFELWILIVLVSAVDLLACVSNRKNAFLRGYNFLLIFPFTRSINPSRFLFTEIG